MVMIMKKLVQRKKEIFYGLLFFVILLGFNYSFGFVHVHGSSMEPTILSGKVYFTNKIIYKWNSPKRFDIIVFEKNNKIYIKRIIGLPGEKIEYRDNQLYINNKLVLEGHYVRTKTNDFTVEEVTFQKRVPEKSYFVMGDNRSHSMDSRVIGFVKEEDIIGTLVYYELK